MPILKQSQDLQQSLEYQAVYFAGFKIYPANETEDHYLGEQRVSNAVNSQFMLKKVSIYYIDRIMYVCVLDNEIGMDTYGGI